MCFFCKTILLDSEATEGLLPEELQERSNPTTGGSHQFVRIQEPVTERFTVPTLSSNQHVSVSNCLEETEKTERPGRTKSVKTNLNHAISQFVRRASGVSEAAPLRVGIVSLPHSERPQLSRAAAQWV